MTRGATPSLTRHLVAHDIPVDGLVPVRSLEEFFLRITEGASGDRALGATDGEA